MKTPPPGNSPLKYRLHIGATVLMLSALPSQAACGNGPTTITNVPSLGGSFYTVRALNAAGQVAGHSLITGDQAEHAFRFGADGLRDLGTLGGSGSYGFMLNDAGQVAGESSITDDAETHTFFYNGTTLLDAGTLGGPYSSPAAINNAGQVVGFSFTAEGALEAYLYSAGTITSLGHLGGGFSQATAINQAGTIVGRSYTDLYEQHAFLYRNGTMTGLGTLGGGSSDAFDVNDSDVVVGESLLSSGETRGFVYANGTMTDLGTLGGTYSTAYAINNAGQIIGRSRTTDDAQLNGFIYSSGSMTDLGTLGGPSSTPYAINNRGQIVGQSEQADGAARAFLWQGGTLTDLNTLLPADSGWVLDSAQFINDAGRIVGTGTYNNQAQWYQLDLGGANNPPVADAGPDQAADCSGVVTLDGSQSNDPDGDALSYLWSENGVVLGTNATLTAAFTAGAHTVTLTVSDPCGDSAQDTVLVTGGDTTPPTISGPSNATGINRNGCEAQIPDLRGSVTVNDNCTPANQLVITQSPAAGTTVGSGQYDVLVTVADAAGNTASCTIVVTVGDDKAPVITRTPYPVTLCANQDGKGKVPDLTRFVKAKDNCTPAASLIMTQSPAAGTLLGVGKHSVVVTVTDRAGNSATCRVSLRVEDVTPPTIHSVTATPNVLSPANGKPVLVKVSVQATDNCDASPSAKIVAVLCDEATSRGDIKVTGDLTVQLEASANARGNGRVYTIFVTVRDDAGNTALKLVTVRVPNEPKRDHPRR